MERELPSQVEESPVSNRRIHYKRHWKAIGNTGQLLHERAVTFIRVAHEGFKIMATRVTGRNNSFMRLPLLTACQFFSLSFGYSG